MLDCKPSFNKSCRKRKTDMFLHHHFIISKNPPRLRLLTHFLTFCFRHYGKLLHHLHFTAAQSDVRCLIKKKHQYWRCVSSAALPCVLSSTPAECEEDRTHCSRDIRGTDRQTEVTCFIVLLLCYSITNNNINLSAEILIMLIKWCCWSHKLTADPFSCVGSSQVPDQHSCHHW